MMDESLQISIGVCSDSQSPNIRKDYVPYIIGYAILLKFGLIFELE
jgi:hypothetical protein